MSDSNTVHRYANCAKNNPKDLVEKPGDWKSNGFLSGIPTADYDRIDEDPSMSNKSCTNCCFYYVSWFKFNMF